MTPEQGRAVAGRMGATYMECSSKEMTGVDEIFESAVTMAIGEEKKNRSQAGGSSKSGGPKKSRKRDCRIL